MKKQMTGLLVLVLLITLMLTGCGATKENEVIAKQAMKDYYMDYNDGDFDGCLKIIHPALIELLGGAESFKDVLETRFGYVGAVVEYDTKKTGFETVNGESEFYYTITVTYQTGEEAIEVFTVFITNGVAQIISIDI